MDLHGSLQTSHKIVPRGCFAYASGNCYDVQFFTMAGKPLFRHGGKGLVGIADLYRGDRGGNVPVFLADDEGCSAGYGIGYKGVPVCVFSPECDKGVSFPDQPAVGEQSAGKDTVGAPQFGTCEVSDKRKCVHSHVKPLS